jgi:hypothetical protein
MQARWQVLNEEIDCTEEEQFLFASLQLQVGLQANVPQPKVSITCKWKLLQVYTKWASCIPFRSMLIRAFNKKLDPIPDPCPKIRHS